MLELRMKSQQSEHEDDLKITVNQKPPSITRRPKSPISPLIAKTKPAIDEIIEDNEASRALK